MKKHLLKFVAVLFVFGLVAAACGSDSDDDDNVATDNVATTTTTTNTAAPSQVACDSIDDVKLQLQWVTQAQFAGYYAAVDQGFYEDLCLNVDILEGAVDIVPVTVLTSGGADFAISWVPRALEVVDRSGVDIINIAQVFERSGTLQVSFKDSNINSVADLAGKRVGNWGFGNEIELFAGLRQNNIDPDTGVQPVQQSFDMQALLNREIDAAQAMIYNEYAQVLEAINPDTGELYTADALNIINWNDEGTAMLQDAIWADRSRLEDDSSYRDIAERFVEGSLEGWIYCRDNSNSCVDIVLDNGPTLGRSHQTWQMNEINALIWPASDDVGVMIASLAEQTTEVLNASGAVENEVVNDWWRADIAEAAIDSLEDRNKDVRGNSWERIEVTLNEGGN